MTTSSADPAKLREWSTGASGIVTDLGTSIGPLRSALDAFRSSEGWQEERYRKLDWQDAPIEPALMPSTSSSERSPIVMRATSAFV